MESIIIHKEDHDVLIIYDYTWFNYNCLKIKTIIIYDTTILFMTVIMNYAFMTSADRLWDTNFVTGKTQPNQQDSM